MKAVSVFILTLTILAHSQSAPILWEHQHLPNIGRVEIIPHTTQTIDFELFDFDLDNHSEVGFLRKHRDHPHILAIKELDTHEYTYKQTRINVWEQGARLFQLHGLSKYYWLTYNATPEGAGTIYLYDRKLSLSDSIATLAGIDRTGTGIWDGNLAHPYVLDLNNDARSDVLVRINTGADGQPRAILGYDLYEKREIFRKAFAPMIKNMRVVDLHNNGKPFIIVSLGGASDGPFLGEFKRDHSYLVIMDTTGQIVKSWEYGGESSYVQFAIADMNSDHTADIIVAYYTLRSDNTDTSKLELIDGRSLEKEAQTIRDNNPAFFGKPVVLSSNDQRPTILTLNSNGDLALYRYNTFTQSFIELKHVKAPSTTNLIFQDDLDHDGRDELFFSSQSFPGFIITDSFLEPKAQLQLPVGSHPNKIEKLEQPNYDTFRYVFLSDSTLYKWEFKGGAAFPPKISKSGRAWHSGWSFNYLVITIIVVFAGLVLGVYLVLRRYFSAAVNPLSSKRSAARWGDSGRRRYGYAKNQRSCYCRHQPKSVGTDFKKSFSGRFILSFEHSGA